MNLKHQTILILDFGGLYKGLIASIVRSFNVYAKVLPYDTPIQVVKDINPIGIILTGGPHSVYKDGSPSVDRELFNLNIPILGICYGMQLMAHILGGKVEPCIVKECGSTLTHIDVVDCPIFEGIERAPIMLMSHSDRVSRLPIGFRVVAHTADCDIASMSDEQNHLYGVQFHPEVERSKKGRQVIGNFVIKVCGAIGDYSVDDYLAIEIDNIRNTVKDAHVILGLSGGLDSCVCAKILQLALPNQLTCVYVDNGLMRDGESEQIERLCKDNNFDIVRVDAKDRFLNKLKGVTNPEHKRKIVGEEFVRIFEEEGAKHGKCYFAQGTIQADVVESGVENCAVIKTHHNVGGLPKDTTFVGLIEPLRSRFKNEVYDLGIRLGLKADALNRVPFPGPGFAIRIIGEVNDEKLDTLRRADKIYCEELERAHIHPDQYFAVITDMCTVGVMGDDRAYSRVIALRAVTTKDYMTCEYVPIPYDVLDVITTRIINEVKGISRVVYDITGKPPATIEWE